MSAAALDRQIRPIYGEVFYEYVSRQGLNNYRCFGHRFKQVSNCCLQQITEEASKKRTCKGMFNRFLRNSAANLCPQALKALALVRSQKVEECLVLCDEVL